MLRFSSQLVLALIAGLAATPVLAQANFDNLTLSPGFDAGSGVVAGYTRGSFSLSAIANRDRNNNPCIGYGDRTPDHLITLQQNFRQLTFQVNSGGQDTTLIVKGPRDIIYCGDDTGSRKDASIQTTRLPAGTYRVWVGSISPRQRWNYTLTVRE